MLHGKKWKIKKGIAIIGPRVNQSSKVAGTQAIYASKKGTAPNTVAKADGKYTILT